MSSPTQYDWFYSTIQGAQAGPVSAAELKREFSVQNTTPECLAWNETMANWTPIQELPDLMNYLNQPTIDPNQQLQNMTRQSFQQNQGNNNNINNTANRQINQSLRQSFQNGNNSFQQQNNNNTGYQTTLQRNGTQNNQQQNYQATIQRSQQLNNNNNNINNTSQSQRNQNQQSRQATLQNTSSKAFGSSTASSPSPAAMRKPVSAANQLQPNDKQLASMAISDSAWVEYFAQDGTPYYRNKQTGEMTYEKPDALKTDAELNDNAGDWYWLPHAEDAFVPAKLISRDAQTQKQTLQDESGRTHVHDTRKLGQLEPLAWSSLKRPVRDLVLLDTMNQPLILYNLRKRFGQREIYTNVGTILISVNPYQQLPLYTPAVVDVYRHRGGREMAPHVFTIADDAYNSLVESGKGQSIVISGESGSGKTECTKQSLLFLTAVSGSGVNNIESKILLSNPILESFGNSKTVRNNNSSRFGKYVELYFNSRYDIVGASNSNYLLEKSRLVAISGDERSYHILYQLCRGIDPQQRGHLQLESDPGQYAYLGQGASTSITGVDDASEFSGVVSAMNELGFHPDEMAALWTLVAALLHLGNCSFVEVGDRRCEPGNDAAVESTCRLLQVDPFAFVKGVTTRVMHTKGQASVDITLSVAEACSQRDSIAKHLYNRMFDWLVVRLNQSIGIGNDAVQGRCIGILDIFGFEIFEKNSFEQLCINYTNERLQQSFNIHTFQLEESVYQQENIRFAHVTYIDNTPVLNLIEGKPTGVLSLIDEELRVPAGSDKGFSQKLQGYHKDNASVFSKSTAGDSYFVIHHYAGSVTYDPDQWVVKNRDQLNADALALLYASQSPFINVLFPASDDSAGDATKKKGLGLKFRAQLDELMNTLRTTVPHYIRCIKPNRNKSPTEFNGTMVLEQLMYSGIFEAVTIRKQGFPFRYLHIDFYKRYKCILPPNPHLPHDLQAGCQTLIQRMELDAQHIQVGRTMILYRAQAYKAMELKRNLAIEQYVIFIQKYAKGWLTRRMKRRLIAARPVLQQALGSKDLNVIDAALNQVGVLQFPLYEWETLKRQRFVIVEEQRIEALLTDLLRYDVDEVYGDMEAAIAAADEINLHSDLSERARAAFANSIEGKKCRAWLVEGTDECDEAKLEWAIPTAYRLKINVRDGEMVRKAEAMRSRIEDEKKFIPKLEAVLKKGGYLREGDTIDTSAIEALLREVDTFVLRTKHALPAVAMARHILALRVVLRTALSTKTNKAHWAEVERLIIASGSVNATAAQHPEVVKARDTIARQAAIEDVTQSLVGAVERLDADQIAYGLLQCQALRVDVVKFSIVPIAREYLAQILEAKRLITQAVAIPNEDALVFAVHYAESFGYESIEVAGARFMRDAIIQLQVEATAALEQFDEYYMQEILDRAAQVPFTSNDIQKIEALLHHTSRDKFIQLALKHALEMHDTEKALAMTIRLKDLYFERLGGSDQFAVYNYFKLRRPQAWAADKPGMLVNRERAAQGMLRHTNKEIHTSLTEQTNPKWIQLAIRMHKNIIGFCNDSPAFVGGDALACDLLKCGLLGHWSRDEIYIQLIKQLTDNPSPASVMKCWQLMSLCIQTFAPPVEFETYLEYFLRQRAGDPARFVRMLHTAIYGGERQDIPSQDEYAAILEGYILRDVDFARSESMKAPLVRPVAQLPGRGEVLAKRVVKQVHIPVLVSRPGAQKQIVNSVLADAGMNHLIKYPLQPSQGQANFGFQPTPAQMGQLLPRQVGDMNRVMILPSGEVYSPPALANMSRMPNSSSRPSSSSQRAQIPLSRPSAASQAAAGGAYQSPKSAKDRFMTSIAGMGGATGSRNSAANSSSSSGRIPTTAPRSSKR